MQFFTLLQHWMFSLAFQKRMVYKKEFVEFLDVFVELLIYSWNLQKIIYKCAQFPRVCLHDTGSTFYPEWARSSFFIPPFVTLHLGVQCLHESGTKVKSFRIEFAPVLIPDQNFQSSGRSYPGII